MKIFIFLAAMMVCGASAADRISFASLPAGEVIAVRFSSQGCFHSSTHEFEFKRGDGMTVEVFELKGKAEQRKSLGTLKLTEQEIAGLDKLLAYYRTNKGDGCTTEDEITFTRKAGGNAGATENYKDGSCGTWERKDLTLLDELTRRFKDG